MQLRGGSHIRADVRVCPLCVWSPSVNQNLQSVPCWPVRGPVQTGGVDAIPGPPPCPVVMALGVRGGLLVGAPLCWLCCAGCTG